MANDEAPVTATESTPLAGPPTFCRPSDAVTECCCPASTVPKSNVVRP